MATNPRRNAAAAKRDAFRHDAVFRTEIVCRMLYQMFEPKCDGPKKVYMNNVPFPERIPDHAAPRFSLEELARFEALRKELLHFARTAKVVNGPADRGELRLVK